MDLNINYSVDEIDANYFISRFFQRPNVENIHQGLHGTVDKATDWEVDKVLKAVWKILSDIPARRELFTKIGEANSFPVRFENIFIRLQNYTLF